MDVLSLLIKSASSSCNLNCRYCFYQDVSAHRKWKNRGIMKAEVVTQLIQNAFQSAKKAVIFSFQGGEPLLAGLPFYEAFVEKVALLNHNNCRIVYSIQTNGVLIDENWAGFFKKNNFLVGVSLDGPEFVHNQNRITNKKEGSFDEVMKGIAHLKKADVNFNILSVLTSTSIVHSKEILSFFKKEAFSYLQFIPYVPNLDLQENDPYIVTPRQYEEFLNIALDWWEQELNENHLVGIRYFDNIISLILGFQPQSCDLSGHCSNNLVIEADGSVYPCDFYVLDEWKMGSVVDNTFEEIVAHPKSKKFVEDSLQVPTSCLNCSFYQLCKGGCKRYKEMTNTHNPYYCEAYLAFFQKNILRLEKLAERIYYV
ncbi:MAG: anaerobic sulfatase maturase [Bacilli bacterium]|nr:anaerobic sulfatase maturase [Bacilli bacterium]